MALNKTIGPMLNQSRRRTKYNAKRDKYTDKKEVNNQIHLKHMLIMWKKYLKK